jgi:hypothetical protein
MRSVPRWRAEVAVPVGSSARPTGSVKLELTRRVEAVRRPEFLDSRVRPVVRAGGQPGVWETKVIQLDGTGAATLEITLDRAQRIFAKLYPDDSGPRVYEKLKALRAAGFGAGERHQVVDPLGFVPEYGMLLTRAAEGPAVSTFIGTQPEALRAGCREAAAWLAKLHTCPLRIGPPQSILVSGELLSLSRRLAKTIRRQPRFLDLTLEIIDVLEKLAAETREGVWVQSHGQYRPIHVFMGDPVVTVIDLDRSRPCDPARDVAEFLHRLRMTHFWQTGSVEPADTPTEEFLTTYRAATRQPAYLANLRFHWARYIFHSLNRKLKALDADDVECDLTVGFYRSELERVVSGRLAALAAG